MFGRVASMVGRLAGPSSGGASYPLVPQAQLVSLFGPPPPQFQGAHTQDRIVSDVWVQPYRGPLDLDRYGCETAEMRLKYRTQFREVPVLRAAVRGKADDISVLEPTVLAADKDDRLSNLAADFIKWTVGMAPGGWGGLIDTILAPGMIDGFSLAEKKLELTTWKGRPCWGLAHVRGLDTAFLRLQLDQYRNVLSVVNLVRGMEYYTPDDVLLYSHNPMYSNPFGQSDLRAATRAANIIEDVYKVWYIALKVYGLPYMTGKAKPTNKKAMAAALASLREGGYAVTDLEEEITVINLAAAAATNGFEQMVHTMREDIFFAVRGVAQPFMEGNGGTDAHTDTSVQQGTSDAGEKRSADRVAEVINRQLIPWLVAPNFDFRGLSGELDMSRMPRLSLGGTDWKQIETVIRIVKGAQEVGIETSAEWVHEVAGIPAPRDEQDKLVSAAEKQQQAQAAAQPQLGAAPPAVDPNAAPAPVATEPSPSPPAERRAAGMSDDYDDAPAKMVATSRLSTDPSRFQFRRSHDADDGTVREPPSEKFDAAKCKPLLVWRDKGSDDEDFVIDGHHRLAWAERDGAKRVPVKYIKAKTAEEAKAIGKKANTSAASVATFSAHVEPTVDAAQVARVVDKLLAELMAA